MASIARGCTNRAKRDGVRHGQPLFVPTAYPIAAMPWFKFAGPVLFSHYLQDFLKGRDPDSNRGHHYFQSYAEGFRYAGNFYR